MGKKKNDLKVKVLEVTSVAAAIEPEDRPRTDTMAAAAMEGPPESLAGISLSDLLEYRPPALPEQPLSARALSGKEAALGFRVKAAAGTLPPVPISYDVATQTWILLADYSYKYQGYTITAKSGFSFDLASVPRPLWWLIAPNELSIVAPLFHDLLYVYRGELRKFGGVDPYRTYTRREADDLFLHLMEVEGVARWRRYAAYAAVRAAGGFYWAT
jgi:hypothetical protein